MKSEVTKEQIHSFLNGHNPMERIVKIEGDYNDDKMCVIYRDENGLKKVSHEPFYPFCWAKQSTGQGLFNGNRSLLKAKLNEYHISCKGLRISDSEGNVPERMERGYRVMFKANSPMSYQKFMQFFKEGGRPIYPNQNDINYGLKEYIVVNPIEQFMIQTGKRQFKTYDDYDQLIRLEFDLETEGLDPQKDCISQIGIRTNKGFEKIIPILGEGEEKLTNEIRGLEEFFKVIKQIEADVITGHNIENFDWWFIDERLKLRGSSLEKFTEHLFPHRGIYKANKQKVLKLGGEMEYYTPTIMWGTNITDSLFAVRRAQALNSNIKKADLKYITKFAKLNKPNRVYVPGKIINDTWVDERKRYAHNDENGHWFKITKTLLQKTFSNDNNVETKRYELLENNTKLYDKKENETFNIVSGRYIVERYLLDDLYETDKVELSFNQTNYQICKMLPVPFEKMCTMGTAAIWKYIMLTWSYENNLAIPELIDTHAFTGGLSRLLVTGYVDRIIKLDYNSLYPSIILTHNINTDIDIMGAMSMMLEYILTKREEYKGEKKSADKKVREITQLLENQPNNEQLLADLKTYKSKYTLFDNMQSAIKVIGNGFFGSYGSGSVFPHSDLICAEETTCTGRMALRLMIGWFTNLGYKPLVGDSVTYDTPILIRREDKRINIVPICDIFNNNEAIEFGEEQYRDFSHKNYEVLTRNGWKPIEYVYKHKTNKQLKRVETKNGVIDCTEDHSLFDNSGNEVKPSTLVRGDKIEIYNNDIDYFASSTVTDREAWLFGFFMADGSSVYCDRTQRYFSKRKGEYVIHRGKRANWKISNKSLDRLNKAKEIMENSFCLKASIKDHRTSSNVYNLVVENAENAKFFSNNFYTSYRYKKVPEFILNASKGVKKAFLDGFCCGDGQNDTIDECIEFGQKSKVAMAGLYFIMKELGYNFRCHNRNDKSEFISFRLRNHHGNLLNKNYSERKEDEVWSCSNITSKSEYVYDISADGTFVNALGMVVCHNTDGFNFQMPKEFRYTKEHPYIGKGLNRLVKEGKEYIDEWGDIMEFNDLFMRNKMGLDEDEVIPANITCARKNYLDLLDNGEVKMVGNTLKSKKMPIYIEKFIAKAAELLLHNKGKEFIEYYYDYIEKIYNMQIPLKDIASVGKIKTSIKEYKEGCKQLTAAGSKKARQAWYELAIKENLNVNMGDSIYYINTGKKKGDSDVKRITKFYYMNNGEKIDYAVDEKGEKMLDRRGNVISLTKYLEKQFNLYKKEHKGTKTKIYDFGKTLFPNLEEDDIVIFNCVLLTNDLVEDEEDHFCDEDFEYNVDKYIEMFNKRIRPLLVVFDRNIRTYVNEKGKEVDNILITNPKDRKTFTEEETKLVSGQPFNETDQDTYEQLMTMEDKEIRFWLSIDKIPTYIEYIDGMDWQKIKEEYLSRQEEMKQDGIKQEIEQYNKIIESLTQNDVTELVEDGILPEKLLSIIDENFQTGTFKSKKWGIKLGTIYDIIDKDFNKTEEIEE